MWFVVACLLYLLCFVLMLFLVWLLLSVQQQPDYGEHATTTTTTTATGPTNVGPVAQSVWRSLLHGANMKVGYKETSKTHLLVYPR